jgi:hypothetical protein
VIWPEEGTARKRMDVAKEVAREEDLNNMLGN